LWRCILKGSSAELSVVLSPGCDDYLDGDHDDWDDSDAGDCGTCNDGDEKEIENDRDHEDDYDKENRPVIRSNEAAES
jgi:hypothetical protein